MLVVMLLSLTSVQAETDLYAADVEVVSQSPADRDQALPGALRQVLQKLSGLRELPATQVLDDSLNAAANYLLSYHYQSVDQIEPDGSTTRQLHLIARFLPGEVDQLVQTSGLPRWPQQRPPVQIWVVIDDGLGRTLQPMEYELAWQAAEKAADRRGLPIVWPELDDEEKQLIDTRLVWGGFTDYLIEKGAPPDGVAIVAAGRQGPVWNLRWSLTSGQQNWNWSSDEMQLSTAMANGIEQMADHMSAATAILASDQGQWTHEISVSNLRGSEDYTRCLNYLQDMSLVTAIEVLGAQPGMVHFRLHLNASPEYLDEAFNRGAYLRPLATSPQKNNYEYLR